MKALYGVISDTHCHNWTTFGSTDANGVNTRLKIILNEITRAAEEVQAAGGTHLFHAGDLFHVRGSVAPSVLNPTLKCFKDIVNMGIHRSSSAAIMMLNFAKLMILGAPLTL